MYYSHIKILILNALFILMIKWLHFIINKNILYLTVKLSLLCIHKTQDNKTSPYKNTSRKNYTKMYQYLNLETTEMCPKISGGGNSLYTNNNRLVYVRCLHISSTILQKLVLGSTLPKILNFQGLSFLWLYSTCKKILLCYGDTSNILLSYTIVIFWLLFFSF